MAVSAANVLVGAPDQSTTGAILSAATGTALPTSAVSTLNVAFEDSGYVSEDGLALTPDRSTNNVKDWSGAIIRTILDEFKGTLKWSHLEFSEASLKNAFGEGNVTVTAATATHGAQVSVAIGADEMPRKSWVFKIKDGSTRVMIVVPNGQVTETGEITFAKSGAIQLPVTLSAYPDSSGKSIYIYTDDGQTV